MRRLPDETIANIRALRRKGLSLGEIRAETGLSRGCIHRHCSDIVLPFGPLKRGPKRRIAVKVVRQLRDSGLSYRTIAKRVGCAVSAVHRTLNQASAA